VTIIPGLARDVDAVDHQEALHAGGRTFAVLGSGVDRTYQPGRRALAAQLVEHGVLISDYAPETPPDASNFPTRLRIVSGLSIAVVVVEAGESSDAMVTAQFAADPGREVFAVQAASWRCKAWAPAV